MSQDGASEGAQADTTAADASRRLCDEVKHEDEEGEPAIGRHKSVGADERRSFA